MHSPRLQVAVHSSCKNQQPVRDAQPSATSCHALFLQEPTTSQRRTALGYKLLCALPARTNSHDEHARHLAELQLQVARRATYQSPQPKENTQGTWLNSSFKSQHGSPRQTQTIVELRGTWPNSGTSRKAALLEGTCIPQSRRKALDPTRAQVAMLFVQTQGTWPNSGTSRKAPDTDARHLAQLGHKSQHACPKLGKCPVARHLAQLGHKSQSTRHRCEALGPTWAQVATRLP
jgi:hypothetical protein